MNPRLLLRLGYEERSTRRDFVLEPAIPASPADVRRGFAPPGTENKLSSGGAKPRLTSGGTAAADAPALNTGRLLLLNSGRSRYREFQRVARFRFQEGRNIFLSYVRSQARGNLNDFNHYFGNLKQAVIPPDEHRA